MKRFGLYLILLVLIGIYKSPARGHLVIIGGGSRPQYLMQKIVELAGGSNARIMILPMASNQPLETAEHQKKQFENLGVQQVDYIICDQETANQDSILQKFNGINGIFFSGGDQSRLTDALLNTRLWERIHEIYRNGGVLSGTSAGAAIMSELMITGNELLNNDSSRIFSSIQSNNIELKPGLGFIKNVIIDQHFVKRKRLNRLISVVLENAHLLGIGIDESTAILVYPDDIFEVIGENTVLVFGASRANFIKPDKNGNLSASPVLMHILRSGQKFHLEKKKVLE